MADPLAVSVFAKVMGGLSHPLALAGYALYLLTGLLTLVVRRLDLEQVRAAGTERLVTRAVWALTVVASLCVAGGLALAWRGA
jgi:hypothetical protein